MGCPDEVVERFVQTGDSFCIWPLCPALTTAPADPETLLGGRWRRRIGRKLCERVGGLKSWLACVSPGMFGEGHRVADSRRSRRQPVINRNKTFWALRAIEPQQNIVSSIVTVSHCKSDSSNRSLWRLALPDFWRWNLHWLPMIKRPERLHSILFNAEVVCLEDHC